jgi:AraC-like DNA-binding protein
MKLTSARPVAPLRDYVRYFQQREALIDAGALIYPIAARPEQILEFYLADRYLVHSCDSGIRELAPRTVVVGPFTYRRAELVLQGRFDVFTVHFQPAGFHQLFGVPMMELADRADDARSVIGLAILDFEHKLADARSFVERIRVATDFLLTRTDCRKKPDAIAAMAMQLLQQRGALRIEQAAAGAGLSARQFDRKFREEVGTSPKLYARIVRFHAALTAKLTSDKNTWTAIAHDLGYYDQMHMVRDFHEFSAEAPARYAARLSAMPEPWA